VYTKTDRGPCRLPRNHPMTTLQEHGRLLRVVSSSTGQERDPQPEPSTAYIFVTENLQREFQRRAVALSALALTQRPPQHVGNRGGGKRNGHDARKSGGHDLVASS